MLIHRVLSKAGRLASKSALAMRVVASMQTLEVLSLKSSTKLRVLPDRNDVIRDYKFAASSRFLNS